MKQIKEIENYIPVLLLQYAPLFAFIRLEIYTPLAVFAVAVWAGIIEYLKPGINKLYKKHLPY